MHPYPYLASCLARQHAKELRELAERTRRRPSSAARHRHGRALRQRTGWALSPSACGWPTPATAERHEVLAQIVFRVISLWRATTERLDGNLLGIIPGA
jgi:hypothetical protein